MSLVAGFLDRASIVEGRCPVFALALILQAERIAGPANPNVYWSPVSEQGGSCDTERPGGRA